jgi:hypothetical protein
MPRESRSASHIPRLFRREFLRIGSVSAIGYYLLPMIKPLNVTAAKKVSQRGSAEFCIFLFFPASLTPSM